MKLTATLALLMITIIPAWSQNQVADKIIAIVSDKIILRSEVEVAFGELKNENPEASETEKCAILEQYVTQKMLVGQAERDSIIVTDEEVEGAIDNRIRYFVDRFGSEQRVEEMAGKSIYQLKEEYRSTFKDNLTAQRVQQSLIGNVKITPQEVTAFYNKIPKDSLPFYPTTVEVGQIVFRPDINAEVEEYAISNLNTIRKEVTTGKLAFDVAAGIHSQDPGSKDNGGELGIVGRDDLVPEFAAAAFRLQNGEVSPVVKTKFGYHIIQMMNRQGEKAKLRHILIKPLITNDMVTLASKKADSVRAILMAGNMQFSAAVGKFSADDATKMSGGIFTNPQTASTFLTMEELEPEIALAVQEMKVGEYSQPQEYKDAQSEDRLVRILYLRNRTEPHKANLRDDYGKIQQVALTEKQNKYLFDYISEKTPTFFIKIDEEYLTCPSLEKWATKR
jgi:peptidyl-prolyl cis-trans isomerase SurA